MKHVIACIDGSLVRDAVCDAAVWLSTRLNKQLLLLHTLERHSQHGADDLSGAIGLGAQSELLERITQLDQERGKLAMQYGRGLLDSCVKRAESQGVTEIETCLRHGDFVESLVSFEAEARFMVVGKTGLDHSERFQSVGSHIETLIRQVQTSVLIAPQAFAAPQNFMLAYDGRDTADRSIARVIKGGLLNDLPCHLVMVRNNESAQEEKLAKAADNLRAEGFSVQTTLLEGNIFEALQQYRRDQGIELLVMGAFAHSKVRRLFLGSNTLRMIEHADIPLVILR